MILTATDFQRALATGQFAPGYLLIGSELFFRDRIRRTLIEVFVNGQKQDVFEHDLAEIPVRDALDDAASLGLFASRRLLWLRNAESLLPRRRSAASAAAGEDEAAAEPQTAGKHSAEAITAYFERPQPSSLVVFEATSLDLSDRDDLRKAERIEKLVPVPSVRLDRPPAAQAARFLIEEARRNGFDLAQEAARNLAEACAGELARAAQELEKLMLYAAGRGRITSRDVNELVAPEASFTLFEISDAIGDRDAARARAGARNAPAEYAATAAGVADCRPGAQVTEVQGRNAGVDSSQR